MTTLADKPVFPNLVPSRRPAHIVVRVGDRDFEAALTIFRRLVTNQGLLQGFRRSGPRVAAESRGQRVRRKRRQARARARRSKIKQARWEARQTDR